MIAKLLRFLAAGFPAFLVAFVLNWLLVGQAHWSKPLAYALVLWAQTTFNFYACVYFVFNRAKLRPSLSLYWRFVSGIALFRAGDWAVYSVLVGFTPIPYLAAQLLNIVVFALLKFRFSESLFEASSSSQETPAASRRPC